MNTLYFFPFLFIMVMASSPRSLSVIYNLSSLNFYQNLTMNLSQPSSLIQSTLYIPDPDFYITSDTCGNLSFWNLTAGNLSFQYQLPLIGLNATNASNLTYLCSLHNRSISNIISLENNGKIVFSAENSLYFYDINTRQVIVSSFHQANITALTYLNKKNWVASGDSSGIITIWSADGHYIKRSWVPYDIITLESQYDSNFMFVGGLANWITMINFESNQIMKTYNFQANLKIIQDLRYTDLMAVAFYDNSIFIVNKVYWSIEKSYQFNQTNSITWDYQNNILSISEDKYIYWINITDYTYILAFQTDPETILSNDLFAKANGYSYLMVNLPQKVMIFNFTTNHHQHSSNSSFVINQTLLWNTTSKTLVTNIIHYHNDKNQREYIITSDNNGIINVLNATNGNVIKTYNDPYNRAIACLIQINNTTLIAYGVGKEIIVWDVEINTLYRNLTGHTNNVVTLAYIPQIDRLISGSLDGFVRVWDISCCSKQSIYVSVSGVLAVDYIEGTSNLLILSNNDVNIQIWNMTSGTILKCFVGGQQTMTGIINIPNTPYFMTSGTDNTTALRNKLTYETVKIFGFDQAIGGFSYDSIMNLILITSGNSLNIFDLDDFNMSTIYKEPSTVSDGLFFYPYILQGPYYNYQNVSYSLLVDATANYLQAFNLTISWGFSDPNRTNTSSLLTLINTMNNDNDQLILSYIYSPSLQYMVTGDSKGYLKCWNASGGNLIRAYKTDGDQVQFIQLLDPDTSIAYTENNKIKILDLKSFSIRSTFDDHLDNVTSLSYNKNKRVLISGSLDGTVRIWNIDNQAVITTIYAFLSGVSQVLYSKNYDLIICSGISESDIRTFKITGEREYTFNHNVQSVTKIIDLNTNGMAYIGFNGNVYIYPSPTSLFPVNLNFIYTPNSLTYDDFHNTLIISTANQIIIYNFTDKTSNYVLNESLSWTYIASSFELVQETPYRFDTFLIEETGNNLKFWNITYNDSKAFTPNGSNYYIDYFKSFQFDSNGDMLLHLDDGERIVAAESASGIITVFQPSSGNQNITNLGISPINNLILASKNGDLIAISSGVKVLVLDTVNNILNNSFTCTGGHAVQALSYDWERNLIIIGDNIGMIYFWNVSNQTYSSNISFKAHENGVNSLKYLGNKELLSSGSNDNTVKLWTLSNNTMLNGFVGPRQAVAIGLLGAADDNSAIIDYLSRSKYLMSVGYGAVYVWECDNLTIVTTYLMNTTIYALQSIDDKNTMILSTNDSLYFINAHDFNLSLITKSHNDSNLINFLSYKNSSNGENYLMMANNKGAFGLYQIIHYNGDQSMNSGGNNNSDESDNKAWIAGVVIGVLAAIVIIGICIACIVKKNRKKHQKEDYGGYKHFNDSTPPQENKQTNVEKPHSKPNSKPISHKNSGKEEQEEQSIQKNDEENFN